ncbi:MAG: S41 family peptidase [Bdellovibrionaceae bacterium]|nr:S41 family peptidase [Pseudobdellovibrionaceae bacterium]
MKSKMGLLILGVVLGMAVNPLLSYSSQRYDNLRLFSRVFNLIEGNYVDTVDEKKLIIGSVRGLLGGLDPYSAYLEKEDFKDFQSETLGRFGGLGIEVTLDEGFLKIISPIEDSPAEKAGIKSGDRIITINGELVKGLDIVEASKKLRGKIGTEINLTVKREGEQQLLNFKIKRASITIKSVKGRIIDKDKGVHYVRVSSFLEKTSKDFTNYITKSLQKNPNSSFIVDLRANPGGLLKQAVDMADLFINEGVIVSTIGRNKEQKNVLNATKQSQIHGDINMVILVDGNSASASEIFAAAMKDHKKATLMGAKTYGKGSVQSVIALENGDGVKLTIARYYSPNGKTIDKKGVEPDKVLKEQDKKFELKDIQNDPWVVEAQKHLTKDIKS